MSPEGYVDDSRRARLHIAQPCPARQSTSPRGVRPAWSIRRRQIIAPCSIIGRTKLREITLKLRDVEHCVTLSRIIVIIYLRVEQQQQQQHPLVASSTALYLRCLSSHSFLYSYHSKSIRHVLCTAIAILSVWRVYRTRSAVIAEKTRDTLCLLKPCQLLHSCTKNLTWNDLNDLERPSRSSELLMFDRPYHFLLVVCSNNDSVLHGFQDITIFTVYVTASDLEKSFIFDKTMEITSHVYILIHL